MYRQWTATHKMDFDVVARKFKLLREYAQTHYIPFFDGIVKIVKSEGQAQRVETVPVPTINVPIENIVCTFEFETDGASDSAVCTFTGEVYKCLIVTKSEVMCLDRQLQISVPTMSCAKGDSGYYDVRVEDSVYTMLCLPVRPKKSMLSFFPLDLNVKNTNINQIFI